MVTNMIKTGRDRPEELRLMKLFFKGALLVEVLDDVFLEGASMVRHKDKLMLTQFRNHFKKKYGKEIEELYEVESKHEHYILEEMKGKIVGVLDDTLTKHFKFEKGEHK